MYSGGRAGRRGHRTRSMVSPGVSRAACAFSVDLGKTSDIACGVDLRATDLTRDDAFWLAGAAAGELVGRGA